MRRDGKGDIRQRFFERFVVDAKTGCWNWQGSDNGLGYGMIGGLIDGVRYSPPGVKISAHRASWILHNGPIPDGQVVRHECDNPNCVNPDHLRLGSIQDNHDDMVRRNRARQRHNYGVNNHKSVLNEGQVNAILKSPKSSRELAEEFGVSKSTICRLRNGKTNYVSGDLREQLQSAPVRKNPGAKGVKNPKAKLTEEQVLFIRSSPLSSIKLAKMFGVSQPHICRIKLRQAFASLE
jgi:transcriptional regulator with XRE-family HTH domain